MYFPWVFSPSSQSILSFLKGEARFVGGSVRNTLLGLEPEDFDLATPYQPEEVMALLAAHPIKVIPTGLSHGTVTALFKDTVYEITTLRHDVQTDGRWATIRYTSSFEEDAQRRDFTMNALYLDGEGTLYDYVQGKEDALRGYIRFIGEPESRIREDFLRIVRFFRFWAFYGREADLPSFQAACALKDHLSILSGERITKELLRLLQAPSPWAVIQTLHKENFFPLLLGIEKASPSFLLSQGEEILGPSSLLVRLASLGRGPFPRLILSRLQQKTLSFLWTPLPWKEAIETIYDFSFSLTRDRLIVQACKEGVSFHELKDFLTSLEEKIYPSFPLTGKDLMEQGFSGHLLGQALKSLRKWWIDHHMKASREECLLKAKNLFSQLSFLKDD